MTASAMFFQAGFASALSGMGSLPIILLFLGAMYFIMIAPGQKKQKAWAEMLNNVKSGDQVTTTGGLRGTVQSVKDDVVVIRVQPDNIRLEFTKSAIAALVTEDPKA